MNSTDRIHPGMSRVEVLAAMPADQDTWEEWFDSLTTTQFRIVHSALYHANPIADDAELVAAVFKLAADLAENYIRTHDADTHVGPDGRTAEEMCREMEAAVGMCRWAESAICSTYGNYPDDFTGHSFGDDLRLLAAWSDQLDAAERATEAEEPAEPDAPTVVGGEGVADAPCS